MQTVGDRVVDVGADGDDVEAVALGRITQHVVLSLTKVEAPSYGDCVASVFAGFVLHSDRCGVDGAQYVLAIVVARDVGHHPRGVLHPAVGDAVERFFLVVEFAIAEFRVVEDLAVLVAAALVVVLDVLVVVVVVVLDVLAVFGLKISVLFTIGAHVDDGHPVGVGSGFLARTARIVEHDDVGFHVSPTLRMSARDDQEDHEWQQGEGLR